MTTALHTAHCRNTLIALATALLSTGCSGGGSGTPSSSVATAVASESRQVSAVATPPAGLTALPATVNGRALPVDTGYRYQWPGVYFEAAFVGPSLYFSVGPGDTILHVVVDSVRKATLVKPVAGWHLINDLGSGAHTVRIEVASENQAGAATFGGFAMPAETQARPMARRARQIEFIGDSNTVGYANTSTTRTCTSEQVWATTDTSQAYGPLTARHYQADYRVNAISGRGIVRNYNGSAGDTVPAAYPYTLFDKATRDDSPAWQPQLIVIALGANDFSTALNNGEKWPARSALQADYQATAVRFIQGLRAANRLARFVLWTAEGADKELNIEMLKVVAKLKAAGEQRVEFMQASPFAATSCDWHASLADHQAISQSLIKLIDARANFWNQQ